MTDQTRSFAETEKRLSTIQQEAAFVDRHRLKSASTTYSILGAVCAIATPVAYSNDNVSLGGVFALATLFSIIKANLKSQDMAKTYERGYHPTEKAEKIAIADFEKRQSWEQPEHSPA